MTRPHADRWRQSIYERIAAAVRNARGSRSAQDIADTTAELGYPITRSQISNFETGRRQSFDVTELLILAAALDVPPLALLFPELPDGMVEVRPGKEQRSEDAYLWATGIGRGREPSPAGQLVAAVLDRRREIANRAHALVQSGLYGTANPELSHEMTRVAELLSGEIARLESVIRESGGVIRDA